MVKEEDLSPPTPYSLSASGTPSVDADVKSERDDLLPGSPSQSPTLEVVQKLKLSPTPTPPPESTLDGQSTDETTSKASTPSLKPPKKPVLNVLQLISGLPVARDEALKSFNEIPDNNYQYKTLGRSRELMESMTCDCSYEHG
jgi:histone-lysine N-methyltransferase SETD2